MQSLTRRLNRELDISIPLFCLIFLIPTRSASTSMIPSLIDFRINILLKYEGYIIKSALRLPREALTRIDAKLNQ